MKENRKELIGKLERLSNAFGPSGFEEEVVKAAASMADGFVLENDSMNNLYMTESGEIRHEKPVFMLDAHLDECGFMVQEVLNDGLMPFVMLGGMDMSSVVGQSVIVRSASGKKVRGIITSRPVHLMTAKERADTDLPIEKFYIDVGCTSRQEVKELYGIRAGDPVVPDVVFSYREENDMCFGKAFDNRVGCLCILETMRRLKEEGIDTLPVEPVGAFASQEEVGERGAMVTSVKVKPDFAVVFEGTPADDYYFRGESALIQGGLRKGVQIRHFDRSTISNPRFIQYAADIAEEKGIRYQCAVRRGGGTNAGIITTKTKDVPTLVLGVPCRYVHTSNNFMAAEDIDAAVDLAVEVIRNLTKDKQDYITNRNLLMSASEQQ